MAMQFNITEEESKKAKHPHEIFLINLIFNHILVFVAILSASSLAKYVVIVPIFSVLTILYLIWGAKRALSTASWYVSGHWQVCAKRNRLFLIMISIMAVAVISIWLISGGNMRPQHWAIGGAAIFPTMVTVLVLIIMESEALHQAKTGILPDWVKERFPQGAPEAIQQEQAQG
ncbi:MAG: hypothetical protein EP315_06815 [Gammaproteobacteria bacterium]|nr:MAG: hypothetical protein EP315_06815 [Gammaproteobacteria bacterium]